MIIGTVGARGHCHFGGDHKDRVKAHAKLTDDLFDRGFVIFLGVGQKGFGARMGNRAQILDQFIVIHTNATVGNGDRLGFFVHGNVNRQLAVMIQHVMVGKLFKLNAVERIRGIGDQFA